MNRMIVFAAAAAVASSASANTADIIVLDGPTAHVPYRDLNLQSRAGRDRLQVRIRSAADLLCTDAGVAGLELKLDGLRCYHAAVSSGMQQLNALVSDGSGGGNLAARH
jgi:UrcA family protein